MTCKSSCPNNTLKLTLTSISLLNGSYSATYTVVVTNNSSSSSTVNIENTVTVTNSVLSSLAGSSVSYPLPNTPLTIVGNVLTFPTTPVIAGNSTYPFTFTLKASVSPLVENLNVVQDFVVTKSGSVCCNKPVCFRIENSAENCKYDVTLINSDNINVIGGYVINSPGHYKLCSNVIWTAGNLGVTGRIVGLSAITINSNDVDLDLGGHILEENSADLANNTVGVYLTANRRNVSVRNGTLKNIGGGGFLAEPIPVNLTLDGLTTDLCGSRGSIASQTNLYIIRNAMGFGAMIRGSGVTISQILPTNLTITNCQFLHTRGGLAGSFDSSSSLNPGWTGPAGSAGGLAIGQQNGIIVENVTIDDTVGPYIQAYGMYLTNNVNAVYNNVKIFNTISPNNSKGIRTDGGLSITFNKIYIKNVFTGIYNPVTNLLTAGPIAKEADGFELTGGTNYLFKDCVIENILMNSSINGGVIVPSGDTNCVATGGLHSANNVCHENTVVINVQMINNFGNTGNTEPAFSNNRVVGYTFYNSLIYDATGLSFYSGANTNYIFRYCSVQGVFNNTAGNRGHASGFSSGRGKNYVESTNSNLFNVIFENCSTENVIGNIDTDLVSGFKIANANSALIKNCRSISCGNGLLLLNSNGISAVDSEFKDNTQHGVFSRGFVSQIFSETENARATGGNAQILTPITTSFRINSASAFPSSGNLLVQTTSGFKNVSYLDKIDTRTFGNLTTDGGTYTVNVFSPVILVNRALKLDSGNCQFENCKFLNNAREGIFMPALQLQSVDGSANVVSVLKDYTFKNCLITNNSGNGVCLTQFNQSGFLPILSTPRNSNHKFIDCQVLNNALNGVFDSAENSLYERVDVMSSGLDGVKLDKSFAADTGAANAVIQNCNTKMNNGNGVYVLTATNTFVNNHNSSRNKGWGYNFDASTNSRIAGNMAYLNVLGGTTGSVTAAMPQ